MQKVIVILILIAILASLGSGLFYMMKDTDGDSKRMVKALTWRIALSLGLFGFLMFGYFVGWFQPNIQ